MSSESEQSIGTAIDYTGSQLELLDANCFTALSFEGPISEKEIIDGMGKRAKARKRAALKAANQAEIMGGTVEDPSSVLSDETNCEIPSIPTKLSSPSRIPVLQKGHQFEKSATSPTTEKSSKIPRPTFMVLGPIDVVDKDNTYSKLSYEITSSDELSSGAPPSFTEKTYQSWTHATQLTDPHPDTMPLGISPLPFCSTTMSTAASPKALESEKDQNEVLVVSEANGTQIQFDVQKIAAAFGLEFAGVRII